MLRNSGGNLCRTEGRLPVRGRADAGRPSTGAAPQRLSRCYDAVGRTVQRGPMIFQPPEMVAGLRKTVFVTETPFMSHAASHPAVMCCQIKSVCPSPLISVTALMAQFGSEVWPGLKYVPPARFRPFMYQTDNQPLGCCHIRSGLESPLKSPTPTTLHVASEI